MAVNIGKDVVHDIALFMKNRMDLESFLSWFETRMASSLTETNHTMQDGYHVYILKHELGENWSLYHKIILELMFNEIFNMTVDITISSTTIRFKFRILNSSKPFTIKSICTTSQKYFNQSKF